MTFRLGQEPIGRLRRPDPRMPRWLTVLLGAVCLAIGYALGALLS